MAIALERFMNRTITLDGEQLTLDNAILIAKGAKVAIAKSSIGRLEQSRAIVEAKAVGKAAVYGVNTGFGWLANKRIPEKELKKLQRNILLSHACGLGDFLSIPETRLAMALRLNVLLKGYTGVRLILCQSLCDLINAEIYPLIPEFGSLGASGDLVPLAHLALPLIGEGEVIYKGKRMPSAKALKIAGLKPLVLEAKEGLSLVNGTQIMLAVGGLAISQILRLMVMADLIAALSYEGARAHIDALHPTIHRLRGQVGQCVSAKTLLDALEGSYLFSVNLERQRVQDPYSLRCAPQVHGASRDMIEYAARVVEIELNAATDNPLVELTDERLLSGGNFHGQPLAMAFDGTAMAVSEYGSLSERRIEVHFNPHLSGLPAFLTPDVGVNSGLMMLQNTASSYVNENRLLANPSCTDSIPVNVGIEDHVSMGMTSARKLKKIVANTKAILALEMVVAAQAVDLRQGVQLGKTTQVIYDRIRKEIKPLQDDRKMYPDLVTALKIMDELLENCYDL